MPKTKSSKTTNKAKLGKTQNIINLYTLEALSKEQYSKKTIECVVNNQIWNIDIDNKFSPTKIKQMIIEGAKKIAEIKKKNESKNKSDNNSVFVDITNYIGLLTVKYFTSVEIDEHLDSQIKMMNLLMSVEDETENISLFEKIINNMDEKEHQKLQEYVVRAREQVDLIQANPELLEQTKILQ